MFNRSHLPGIAASWLLGAGVLAHRVYEPLSVLSFRVIFVSDVRCVLFEVLKIFKKQFCLVLTRGSLSMCLQIGLPYVAIS